MADGDHARHMALADDEALGDPSHDLFGSTLALAGG